MSTINPLEVTKALAETYSKYLKTIVTPRDLKVRNALHAAIDEAVFSENNLIKGPYLEAQPPYVKGVSIRDLVAEGVLSEEFLKFEPSALPIDRALYSHQVRSIRRVAAGHNVIVATGTGSGKTESFLIPIINELVREKEQGKLGPGVRALLLYPMNALANDQVKRLRGLLAHTPEITFGRYTGETATKYEDALVEYREFEGRDPLPNELISRKQMQETPPQILLTNYAMLEYLLLRPGDRPLFEGQSSGTWKFIVADEAHTYDGAHGVEVANLINKLRERVDRSLQIQTIGTTATIGQDREGIRAFAESFFGNTFQISEDSDSPDLIEPERSEIPIGDWGPLTAVQWASLRAGQTSFRELFPGDRAASFEDYDLLQSEIGFQKLRLILAEKPTSLAEIAAQVFGEPSEVTREAVLSMVEFATRTKNPAVPESIAEPALSARFHLFARATEGVFSCLKESPHLHLYRQVKCHECDNPSFEMAGCKRCGGAFYAGSRNPKGLHTHFAPQVSKNQILLYPDQLGTHEANEDDEIYDEDLADSSPDNLVHLCVNCGLLDNQWFESCPVCGGRDVRKMRAMDGSIEGQTKCPQCGTRGRSVLRRLESGNDAAVSVLATELYLNMPQDDSEGAFNLPGGGRKLMVFSDSRQQAAFFAPYLEETHARIMWRKIFLQALIAQRKISFDPENIPLVDLRQAALEIAERSKFFQEDTSVDEKNRVVLTHLQHEAVSTDTQMNLEGTGLVFFEVALPSDSAAYAAFNAIGLSTEVARHTLQTLLSSLREGGILTRIHPSVDLQNAIFEPRKGPLYLRGTGSLRKYKVFSWSPTTGQNARLNFLKRLLADQKIEVSADTLLANIWTSLTAPVSPFASVLKSENVAPNGLLQQLNSSALKVRLVDDNTPLYSCNLCGRITPWGLASVCPRFGCEGALAVISIEDSLGANHYRSLYLREGIQNLISREHTAQLESKQARKVQTDFIQGRVNVLSSSTTFELGVDVGELQSVLLRNVPPSTANYLQRAGRAGRRSDSAALILTYAQRRPHDLAKFANPVQMIAGAMRAPYVDLDNKRIFMRHMFSVVFASYFKTDQGSFGSASKIFLDGEVGGNTAAKIWAWAEANSEALREKYTWLLPAPLSPKADAIWVEMLDQFKELLNSVEEKLRSDVAAYQTLMDKAHADMVDPTLSDKRQAAAGVRFNKLKAVMHGLVEQDIIGFLSRQNLLPKYGFPVDTVELKPRYSDPSANHIEMSRDLAVAIFEYAPGNQLVANGYVWESEGLNSIPGKAIQWIAYANCDQCGYFNTGIADPNNPIALCSACSMPVHQRVYAWPKWGFASHGGEKRPGESSPRIRWNRSLYLAKDGVESEEPEPSTPSSVVKAQLQTIADLLVINNGSGPGSGYHICTSCYRAVPGSGKVPLEHFMLGSDDRKCGGSMDAGIQLGHRFETDLIKFEINFEDSDLGIDEDLALSLEYAILEAASDALQISHDDIDIVPLGVVGRTVLFALVDAVPAGAGFANLVARHLPLVFKQALVKVERCECGEDTSCYECLRSYSNQRLHDRLSRGLAISALKYVLSK